MTTKLKIDFISDIACPWCAIGVGGLEQALAALEGQVDADITFHPYELSPDMQAGGQNGLEHISRKFGMPHDQIRSSRDMIRARAASVGVTMNTSDESRIYNTFDAHRLLAWAKDEGRQLDMKRRLLALYWTDQVDPGDRSALVVAAEEVGLDGSAARAVLESDRYVEEVRAEEELWRSRGINSVPTVIVNDRHLISGAQPPEEFERRLRDLAAEGGDAS
ncbi:DsbA family oxidoreductase [Sphingopyxis sp. JAI108]|uniref:DsbA family oxidoreductase n=1 Tax=Sphingopyxis sp. JAI108 TaxID=2723060 RepID=UPI0015C7DD19|nr:putative DsbA family dithiol-disulfide isomerase [Sphingopyxis sp. JAI108]